MVAGQKLWLLIGVPEVEAFATLNLPRLWGSTQGPPAELPRTGARADPEPAWKSRPGRGVPGRLSQVAVDDAGLVVGYLLELVLGRKAPEDEDAPA